MLTKGLSSCYLFVGGVTMSRTEVLQRISEIEQELETLPRGRLVYKKIKNKEQPYLQWTEGGKTISQYIKLDVREETMAGIERRNRLTEELKSLKAGLANTEIITPYIFKTNITEGEDLERLIAGVKNLRKRNCYGLLDHYLKSEMYGRVCVLYGLRRTGKTTLLFQAVNDLPEEEHQRAVYIKARTRDTMSDLNSDLRELFRQGFRYVFLDEVTLLEDFIDSASLFSDIFAMQGMKIVLSGTDSLGFWMSLAQELYDRAYTIHTTYIPFREYSYLLGIDDIDEYIRYGGTLRAGELAFDDEDAKASDAAFRDDESTRRYIDTAICNNIQHSLLCCSRGNYIRHLWSLYEAGELTSAINRIIESMNHRFLLSTLLRPFKSHDLGSATQLLEKQPDGPGHTDILSRIDREAITKKLMEMLEIRNQEDLKVGITEAHVSEIRKYLKALDLVADCPRRNIGTESDEYVLFTQPGMRYCQAQALVHVLINDEEFASFPQAERDLACAKILEDVRGRMMEDIVLLDTVRANPSDRSAFKLSFERSELDMVIYSSADNTCEAYEIKHSKERVTRKYHVLEDEEQCAKVEQQYGKITRKCVIYRGPDIILENGIEYRNAEEYLKSL